jgi:hypothetical protein
LRTADDYRAEARALAALARKTSDPKLKEHYEQLAAAFRELAKFRERKESHTSSR